MDEFRARRVVDALRDRGVNAHLFRGNGQYGVRVTLPGGREAEWDTDGTAGLDSTRELRRTVSAARAHSTCSRPSLAATRSGDVALRSEEPPARSTDMLLRSAEVTRMSQR